MSNQQESLWSEVIVAMDRHRSAPLKDFALTAAEVVGPLDAYLRLYGQPPTALPHVEGQWSYDMEAAPYYEPIWVACGKGGKNVVDGCCGWDGSTRYFMLEDGYRIDKPVAWREKEKCPAAPPFNEQGVTSNG